MFDGLPWAALAMGLLGGSHCLVMCAAPCGAVVGMGSTEQAIQWHPKPTGTRSKAAVRMAAFLLGRLFGYAAAGAAVVYTMQGFSWVVQQAYVFRPAWTLVHFAVLVWGLLMVVLARQPAWVEWAGRALWRRAGPVVAAPGGVFAAGLAWALLPCGLLYSALLLAALSSGPLEGAVTMALFAAGSGLWLAAGPWAWQWLRQRFHWGRRDWGTRIGGLLLCGVAAAALWNDLVVRPSLICQ